jgi:hypothetical protein
MPEISIEALIVCIQAVAAELRILRDGAHSGELEAEEYALLEERERVAKNLEAAYDKVAEHVLNLPPYDELAG